MSTIVLEQPVHCRRCNRLLTDPKSIKRGYGSECQEQIALEIMVTEHAREANEPGWLCQTCEQPTPSEVFHKGQCPQCYYGVTRLADLDVEPFAEVG